MLLIPYIIRMDVISLFSTIIYLVMICQSHMKNTQVLHIIEPIIEKQELQTLQSLANSKITTFSSSQLPRNQTAKLWAPFTGQHFISLWVNVKPAKSDLRTSADFVEFHYYFPRQLIRGKYQKTVFFHCQIFTPKSMSREYSTLVEVKIDCELER